MKNLILIIIAINLASSCKTNKEQANIDRELELIEKNSGNFDPSQFEQSSHYALEYSLVDGNIDPAQTPTLSKRTGSLPFKNGSINGPVSVLIFDNTFKEIYRYSIDNPLNMRHCIPDEGVESIKPILNGTITILVPDMPNIGGIIMSTDSKELLSSKFNMKELIERQKVFEEQQIPPQDTTLKSDPGRK